MAAIDTENSIRLAAAKTLYELAKPLEAVLEVAIENLRARSPSRFERDPAGFYVSNYGDLYDASRILLPHLFEQLPLRGEPVAVVVARTGIVVAGSEDLAALDAMAAFVEDQMETELRPISYLPLLLAGGVWVPFDAKARGLAKLNGLRVRQQLWDYGEQKAALEAYLARQDSSLAVEGLEVAEQDGWWRTWTSWTGVGTLSPMADGIVLEPGDGRLPMARHWADVLSICGPVQPEPGLYPPRYRFDEVLSPEAWGKLAAFERPSWIPTV